MAGDDEDIDDIETSTGSEGTSGQDAGGGDEESDLSTDQPESQEDDGSGAEPKAEVDAEAAPAAQPTRGQTRFQRLANEAKAAREEAQRARREAEELRRAQWQQNQQVTEQQERDRLALMTPDERAEYHIAKMRREFDAQRQSDRMQTAAMMDKTAYDAKATISPIYARFKDEVESRFQEQLSKGQPVERELILKVLLGERALDGASNANRKAAAQGKRRVDAQRVAPNSGRSDTASDRGKRESTAEERLKGVFI